MELAYFKKEVPSTPIHLANGRKVIFDSLDGLVGYTMSADPGIISQLDNCIRSGIGGVSRVSKEAYESFAKKKPNLGLNLQRTWREELGANELSRPGAVAVAPAAARPVLDAAKIQAPAAPVPAKAAEAQQPFKPRSVKRKT